MMKLQYLLKYMLLQLKSLPMVSCFQTTPTERNHQSTQPMDKLMKRTFNAQVSEQVLKTVHDRELHTFKDPKSINIITQRSRHYFFDFLEKSSLKSKRFFLDRKSSTCSQKIQRVQFSHFETQEKVVWVKRTQFMSFYEPCPIYNSFQSAKKT